MSSFHVVTSFHVFKMCLVMDAVAAAIESPVPHSLVSLVVAHS